MIGQIKLDNIVKLVDMIERDAVNNFKGGDDFLKGVKHVCKHVRNYVNELRKVGILKEHFDKILGG